MTFSFKGPTRGLPTREQFILNVANVKTFGSHTVLWLFSHFQFLLYQGSQFACVQSFFFQCFFARVWSFFIRFPRKRKQADEQSRKKSEIPTRTLVPMFKQARTCSQFFDMTMRHTPGHLLVYASGVRKCVVQSILAGYSPNSILV